MTATPRAPAPAPPPVQVFVFDDRLGQKEGDELSKILARFPSRVPDDALASQIRIQLAQLYTALQKRRCGL